MANTNVQDLVQRWIQSRAEGTPISVEELCAKYPEYAKEVRQCIETLQAASPVSGSGGSGLGIDATSSLNQVASGNVNLPPQLALALKPGMEPVPGYKLVELLGRGSFGQVWKAIGPGNFPLALKFVSFDHPGLTIEIRSLNLMRRLRHANLVSYIGTWKAGDTLIIGMDLADKTLMDRLEECKELSLPGIPFPELIEYMRDAAKGIDFLNDCQITDQEVTIKGIQHRDIKPHNLMLVSGSVRVGDFGLAKMMEQTIQGTKGGAMTLAYAAPEFFDKKIASTSDQYSLAATYHQLRTGELPIAGTSFYEIMMGHMVNPPNLSRLPADERPIVYRALQKNPEKRWPNCRAFVDALSRCSGGKVEPFKAAPESHQDRFNALYSVMEEKRPVTSLGNYTEMSTSNEAEPAAVQFDDDEEPESLMPEATSYQPPVVVEDEKESTSLLPEAPKFEEPTQPPSFPEMEVPPAKEQKPDWRSRPKKKHVPKAAEETKAKTSKTKEMPRPELKDEKKGKHSPTKELARPTVRELKHSQRAETKVLETATSKTPRNRWRKTDNRRRRVVLAAVILGCVLLSVVIVAKISQNFLPPPVLGPFAIVKDRNQETDEIARHKPGTEEPTSESKPLYTPRWKRGPAAGAVIADTNPAKTEPVMVAKEFSRADSPIKLAEAAMRKAQEAIDQRDYQTALKQLDIAAQYPFDRSAMLLLRGHVYRGMNDIEKAKRAYSDAIEIDPSDAVARRHRADLYWDQKQFRYAFEDYGVLVDNKKADSEVHVRRAIYFLSRDDADNAIRESNAAIALNETYTSAYLERGKANMRKQKWADAAADFSFVLTRDPDSPIAHAHRGEAYRHLDKLEEAVKDFSHAINNGEKSELVYAGRGLARFGLGRRYYDAAWEDLKEAIAINDKNAEVHAHMGAIELHRRKLDEAVRYLNAGDALAPGKYAQLYLWRGTAHRLKGKFDEAISDYRTALRTQPELSDAQTKNAHAQLATAYLKRVMQENNPELDKVFFHANQAGGEESDQPLALMALGIAKVMQKEFRQGIKILDDALHNNAVEDIDFIYAFRGLAEMEMSPPDIAKAVGSLDFAVRQNDKNVFAWKYLGEAFRRQGKTEEAIKACDRAITLKPDEYAYATRGLALLKLGKAKYPEAKQAADAALQINGKYDRAHVLKGYILLKEEEYTTSLAHLNLAIQANTKNAEAYGYCAEALLGLGQFTRAIERLGQAYRLDADQGVKYLHRRAQVLLVINDFPAAIKDYDQILQMNTPLAKPFHAEAYMGKGEAHLGIGRLEKKKNNEDAAKQQFEVAEKALNEAINLAKTEKTYYNVRAEIRSFLGKYKEEIDDLTYFIKGSTAKAKDLAHAYARRGLAYQRIEPANDQATVDDWTEAIRLNPEWERPLGEELEKIRRRLNKQ